MPNSIQQIHDYWNGFYAATDSVIVPDEPSPFARWVTDQLGSSRTIVEFGFGTGRDALWFADRGHSVVGYDFAESAVELARARASARKILAQFYSLNLYETADVERVAKDLMSASKDPVVYGRFLLHALEDHGRTNLLDLTARCLAKGGSLFLEFRTGADKGVPHLFGDGHFRRYLDPRTVAREIEDRGGSITHLEEGYGLAVLKSEDPFVARLIARWAR